MKAEGLLAHYARIADAPDAIAKLRRFVLDLAMRGKLVAQDAGEESASKLLAKIWVDGVHPGAKRKRNDSDALPRRGPFSVPNSWAWTTLGAIARYGNPAKVNSNNELHESMWVLDLEDVEKNTGRLLQRMDSLARPFQSSKTHFDKGDVLFGKLRPYLCKVLVAAEPGVCTTEIVPISPAEGVSPRFLELVMRSPLTMSKVDQLMYGVKMPRLGTSDANRLLFPLPPSEEQHRIVAKVDELMALCDQLEVARMQREATRDRLAAASLARLNAPNPDTFPADARFALDALPALTTRPDQIKQLRQTILNLAVRGKLVPQDPGDEPASMLLSSIAAQRMEATKAGSRRQRELRTIDLSEAPFDLPSGWAWGRFPELGTFGRGKSKHRPRNDARLFEDGSHALIQTGDVARSNGVVDTITDYYNDFGLAQSFKWPRGTLCITIAANIADSGILSFDACFPDSVVGFIPAPAFKTARYFEYFVRTGKANLMEFAPATAQKNINLEILNSVLIPLPPLAEQERIVAKVDELMALCDQLEASLTAGETTRRRLLVALLHEALAPAAEASSEHPRAAVSEYTTAGDKACFVG